MRTYDIILLGATGFTGQLTARYLSKQEQPIRWAIAGRDTHKLNSLRQELESCGHYLPDVLLADSSAPDSLAALARQTRVLITTVGPYLKYGEGLVEACVQAGCDYVDLTGEPEFVHRMRQRFHAQAMIKGVRIVHCCGFDSIPHDLGVYFTMRLLQDRLGSEAMAAAVVDVVGTVKARGEISGGTWQSALNAMARAGSHVREERALRAQKKSVKRASDGRIVGAGKSSICRSGNDWAAPLPTIDPQIVLTTARNLSFYGRQFSYSHKVAIGSLGKLALGAVGIAGIFAGAQFGPTRRLLEKVKRAGDGPSPEARAKHWFRVRFVAQVTTAQGSQQLLTEVSGGDPGYDETAKMLSESALSLAFGGDKLPQVSGVLTPALAMGDVLLSRLKNAGMQFVELSH